nr:CAP domain-containing protein [Streptomyces cavernae]
MGRHRKKTHYRQIVIASVALGSVGVPSIAVACTDWQETGQSRFYEAEKESAWDSRSHVHRSGERNHRWNGSEDGERAPTASKTPSASASPSSTATPKPKTTAPKPRPTASSSVPKATASAAAPSTPSAPPSTPKATATASGAVARIVQLVNAERGKVGCSAVTLNATLTKAAQAHSVDMAAHNNMSHTGSDGSTPGDRITRAGYAWSTYGENVAYGYSTPEQVMAGWMASPGHRANILNCAFKEIGVGLAQPGDYWTQDFGTAR